MEPSPPAKYVLYTHFSYHEREDFAAWQNGTRCADLQGIQYLLDHFTGLRELLTSPAYEGLLVLFYAPGFADCLEGIAQGLTANTLLEKYERLRFVREVAQYLDEELEKHGELASRLRFVTPLDLYDIFGRMNWNMAQNLQFWFIGSDSAIRYDTPKIVEAIVRLRLLGTGVPVFRLDYDVLFRGEENNSVPDLGLFKVIASCLRAYQLRRDESSVATFMLSASYDIRSIFNPNTANQLQAWGRAFATRIFPALPINIELAENVHSNSEYTWDNYAGEVFSQSLARRFYGFSSNGLRSNGVTGLGKIGAHPMASVISGAMLCLSEGAILDLPPFSNFGLNVSWIDDHLKYCLHRELRHFTTVELKVEPLLSDAKLDAVMVQKARALITNLPDYVLGNYLPTMLWGTVMDSWVTPDPLLKYRPEDLSEEECITWQGLPRNGQSQAILASALQTALEKGHIDRGEKQALQRELLAVALQRITDVRKQWAELTDTDAGIETFASIWAKGTVQLYFPGLVERCNGIAESNVSIDTDITKIVQINHYLHDDLRKLIDDAIDYIEWTLHWPRIVQVVRSVEQGTLRTDMSWNHQKKRRL